MKKLFLLTSMLLSLLYVPSTDIDLPKGAKKKVLKSIDALWPEMAIEASHLANENILEGDNIKTLKRIQIYRLKNQGTGVGFLFLSAAPSRYNDFDLMVIYNNQLEIIDSKVLTYREDWGGEIASRRWLRQFLKKTAKDQLVVGRDIQGISGATISVNSATKAIKLMTLTLQGLEQRGLLH